MHASVQNVLQGLTDEERAAILHELLVPYLRDLEQEECVVDEAGAVMGFLISTERRDQLIPSDLLDRWESDSYKKLRKPFAKVLGSLPVPIGQ